MPRGTVIESIPAGRAEVFRLLHDYDRRLEWDSLLRAAHLCDGWPHAALHATSICKGRALLGGIEMKAEYISFRPGEVAAVKMVNRPPFFDSFAATILHRELANGWSQVEYKYQFRARPVWLRWLLHPIMQTFFRWETKKRLRGLRTFFEVISASARRRSLVDAPNAPPSR
jgi:hypothetical protein